jgi:hypothetical protein
MNSKSKRSKHGTSLSAFSFVYTNAYQMTGCETCRRRKVKCDEIHPYCTECTRLRFSCRWSQGKRQPMKTTRRGFGPVKSRDSTWIPRPIVPIPSTSTVAECVPTMTTVASPPSQSDWDGLVFSDGGSSSSEWLQDFDRNSEALTFSTSPDHFLGLENSQLLSPCQNFPDLEQLFKNYESSNYSMSDRVLEMFPSPSLSDYHMTLPNSLTLTNNEHEALRHYQTTYSLYRTTKDPNWSTHKVLLRMGSQDNMIMHLLLAVSLNDYSLRRGNSSSSPDAENHFQAGAQLLIRTTTDTAGSDSVTMMAAYFFIYLYMSKRRSTAPQRLSQLSSTVLDYVKKHNLVSSCIKPATKAGQSDVTSITSIHNRSLLARLIMWTLDEDIKCSFQGSGGHFARYLAVRDTQTKEIYDASRNALGDHWGSDYPHTQVLDDDQNSTVLEFLWAMMPLWQDINDLSGDSDSAELIFHIEQKFSLLEEVCIIFLCRDYLTVFRNTPPSFDTLPKRPPSHDLEYSSTQTTTSFSSMLFEFISTDQQFQS